MGYEPGYENGDDNKREWEYVGEDFLRVHSEDWDRGSERGKRPRTLASSLRRMRYERHVDTVEEDGCILCQR